MAITLQHYQLAVWLTDAKLKCISAQNILQQKNNNQKTSPHGTGAATDLGFEMPALPPGVLLLLVLGVAPNVAVLVRARRRHVDELVVVAGLELVLPQGAPARPARLVVELGSLRLVGSVVRHGVVNTALKLCCHCH